MSQKTLEYLIAQGLVRTVPGNSDYIIVNSFTNPLSNSYTASETSEYAIKISDFFAAIAADTPAEEITFDNTGTIISSTNVQNAITEVLEIAYPLKTVVNISSAQILNMGNTPVELLPAPGINKYYEIDKIILESSGTLNYNIDSNAYIYTSDCIRAYVDAIILQPQFYDAQKLFSVMSFLPDKLISDGVNVLAPLQTNKPLNLEYYSDDGVIITPTGGNGTMRVIIEYRIRAFGV